jgi:hypothetical protein
LLERIRHGWKSVPAGSMVGSTIGYGRSIVVRDMLVMVVAPTHAVGLVWIGRPDPYFCRGRRTEEPRFYGVGKGVYHYLLLLLIKIKRKDFLHFVVVETME